MKNPEFKKSTVYEIARMDEYIPHGIGLKNILERATGNVSAVFIDKGEQLTEKLSRFDHFIQVIEGKAEVFIGKNSFILASGEFIIIPANSKTSINANERCKIISTIIKSGYE